MLASIKEFVSLFSDEELIHCVEEFDKFEASGIIGGNSIIKIKAKGYMSIIGTDSNIVLYMRNIAFECWKRLGKDKLETLKKKNNVVLYPVKGAVEC